MTNSSTVSSSLHRLLIGMFVQLNVFSFKLKIYKTLSSDLNFQLLRGPVSLLDINSFMFTSYHVNYLQDSYTINITYSIF